MLLRPLWPPLPPPSMSRRRPNGRSMWSCTTSTRSSGSLSARSAAATLRPESFMNVVGCSRSTERPRTVPSAHAAVEPAPGAGNAVTPRELLDHQVAGVVRRALVRRPGIAQADDEVLDVVLGAEQRHDASRSGGPPREASGLGLFFLLADDLGLGARPTTSAASSPSTASSRPCAAAAREHSTSSGVVQDLDALGHLTDRRPWRSR